MDHTLASYKPDVERLIFRCFMDHLVHELKYPSSLLDVQYDFDFCAKGIVLDKETGNFISLDDQGRVTQAIHGHHRALTSAQIREAYGADRKWSSYNELCAMRRSSSFMVFTTYFDTPTMVVWAELIDLLDAGLISHRSTLDEVTVDIMDTFEHLFAPDQFLLHRGGFFTEMVAHPDEYLQRDVDGLLHKVCTELRQTGHRLALITNSRGDYAQFVMDVVYGSEWRSMFDLVVMHAMKPKFFKDLAEKRPFYLCSNCKQPSSETVKNSQEVSAKELKPLSEFELGSLLSHLKRTTTESDVATPAPVLAQGTSSALAAHIGMGASADEPVLYFGDHLHADVVSLPKHWYGAAVVEEMNMDSDERTSRKVWGNFFSSAPSSDDSNTSSGEDDGCIHGPSHWLSLLDRHALVCMPGVGSLLAAYHQGGTNGVIAMHAHHAVAIDTAEDSGVNSSAANIAVGTPPQPPPNGKAVTRWFPSVPESVHSLVVANANASKKAPI
jgi:HAD superfamily 5'-nucleotidase-like hydrolase